MDNPLSPSTNTTLIEEYGFTFIIRIRVESTSDLIFFWSESTRSPFDSEMPLSTVIPYPIIRELRIIQSSIILSQIVQIVQSYSHLSRWRLLQIFSHLEPFFTLFEKQRGGGGQQKRSFLTEGTPSHRHGGLRNLIWFSPLSIVQ